MKKETFEEMLERLKENQKEFKKAKEAKLRQMEMDGEPLPPKMSFPRSMYIKQKKVKKNGTNEIIQESSSA